MKQAWTATAPGRCCKGLAPRATQASIESQHHRHLHKPLRHIRRRQLRRHALQRIIRDNPLTPQVPHAAAPSPAPPRRALTIARFGCTAAALPASGASHLRRKPAVRPPAGDAADTEWSGTRARESSDRWHRRPALGGSSPMRSPRSPAAPAKSICRTRASLPAPRFVVASRWQVPQTSATDATCGGAAPWLPWQEAQFGAERSPRLDRASQWTLLRYSANWLVAILYGFM